MQYFLLHVCNAYLVEPRYATGQWHLSTTLANDTESVIKAYANTEFISKQLFQAQSQKYKCCVEFYLLAGGQDKFCKFKEYIRKVNPLSGPAIRDLFKKAESLELDVYGVSNYD